MKMPGYREGIEELSWQGESTDFPIPKTLQCLKVCHFRAAGTGQRSAEGKEQLYGAKSFGSSGNQKSIKG